ncbi:MAG: hypothetical protein Ta2G_10480 [Termitinemataceae bacterium]|nr:MAG: hypothetical protein Ta2G_10480 [Termitinemataceae bacterium]
MPFLPVLIRGYGYSPTMVGVLLAVCEGAAIASPFVFGHFADRLGRYRPIIAITLLLSLACGLFLRFSNNLILCAIVVPLLSFNYRAMQPLIDAVSTINLGKEGNYGKHRAIGSLTFVLILFFFAVDAVCTTKYPSEYLVLGLCRFFIGDNLYLYHSRILFCQQNY